MLKLIKEEERWVFIYWYFNHGGVKVWEDKRNPIIPAIATLRHFLPNVQIEVLDVSKKKCNWGNFPDLFNFKVTERKFSYSEIKQHQYTQHISLELLSKTKDCYELSKTIDKEFFLILDVDIFWVKNPLPLAGSNKNSIFIGSNKHRSNSGLYYYKKGNSSTEFIENWCNINFMSANDSKFCKYIFDNLEIKTKNIIEETTLDYIINNQIFENLYGYPSIENFCYCGSQNSSQAKALHFFDSLCSNTLNIVMQIKELMDIMNIMFPTELFEKIFTKVPERKVSYKIQSDVKSLFKS